MGFPPTSGGAGGILQQQSLLLTTGDITSASATFTDLTGVTVTLSTGAHRCLVGLSLLSNHTSATIVNVGFDIAIDGTRQGGTAGLGQAPVSSSQNFGFGLTYLTPVLTTASHTIKIQWQPVNATAKVFASATAPVSFWVIETSLST